VSFDPTMLFLSLVTGGIGFVLLVYGKKEARVPHIIAGLAFMVYPYFVDTVITLIAIGIAMGAALWFAVRQGY
jgi:hypothetical protein